MLIRRGTSDYVNSTYPFGVKACSNLISFMVLNCDRCGDKSPRNGLVADTEDPG